MKKFYFFRLTLGALLLAGMAQTAHAAFAPGETLDPGCAPTTSTCTVTQIQVNTSTGNFGISTSSPFSRLTVSATSSLSNLSLFSIFAEPTASATTTALTVLSSGLVGIGTSTPGSILSTFY